VNTYRILPKPWVEVKPVQNMNQQGMHAKSRLGAFVYQDIRQEIILDGKKHPQTSENRYPAAGCLGLLNFQRSTSTQTGQDFLWFLTFPSGAETQALTYHGIHYPDPYWEWDDKTATPCVGANYAYLGEKVVIGALNFGDNWQREDVKKSVNIGEVYTSNFTAPYSGRWRICGSINDDWNVTDYFTEATVNAGQHFTFVAPAYGILDYLVVYMWDRNLNTPDPVFTPMDVYREAILGVERTAGSERTESAEALARVKVFPNPFVQKARYSNQVTFSDLPEEVVIRIYGLNGGLLKEIKHREILAGGSESWNITNMASGIYIYSLSTTQANQNGKISIVK